MTDERGGDGLEQTEEGAKSAAEENDIIAGVDGASESGLVAVQTGQDRLEEGGGAGCVCDLRADLAVAVEFE